MASLALGVKFTAVSAGTVDFVYSSAVTGYVGPAATSPAMVNGKTYRYRAESADLSQWEFGSGVYTSSTQTIARTTVTLSSTGSKVSFTAAPFVGIVPFPDDILQFDDAMSLTSAQKLQGLSNLGLPPQCGRLSYVSATAIKFVPYNGDLLKINGSLYRIPSAGIAGVANTSVFVNGVGASNLAASTLYYVYAFINSGTVTADFSTTGRATSSTAGNEGVEIKSGDDTRTLVGMVYTNASSQFTDAVASRLTLSWFNRRQKGLYNSGANTTTTSTALVDVLPSNHALFLCWGDAEVWLQSNATIGISTAGYGLVEPTIDGTTTINAGLGLTTLATGAVTSSTSGGSAAPAEGFHYGTISGAVDTGTHTLQVQNPALTGWTMG